MPVMQQTIDRAREILARRGEVLREIGGPYPPAAFALFLARETNDKSDALTSQAGFWEVGACMLTVAKTDGSGTAKDADVHPFSRVSSYYAAQLSFQRTLQRWGEWLADNRFHYSPLSPGCALTLMHLRYSIGWNACKQVVLAGRKNISHPVPREDVLSCLRSAFTLSNDKLPDPGPQSDDTIRMRIAKALALPADASRVGPLEIGASYDPRRIDGVQSFPHWETLRNFIRSRAAELGIKE